MKPGFVPDLQNYCHRHSTPQRLESASDKELLGSFGISFFAYCPALWCDFVEIHHDCNEIAGDVAPRFLLMMELTAVRQKAFFRKFVKHFVGDGK